MKSNFKRTSSLRLPKTTSTLKTNNLFSNRRPSIQRGISIDDGPISTNFLKSSEYDEMPVKSACVNPSSRANTPKHYPAPVMREPGSVQRRKDLKLDLKLSNAQNTDRVNNLSKTDSLAIFLKYENELCKTNSILLTEKDIKDKNNSFNKRLSNISTDASEHSLSPSVRSPHPISADYTKTEPKHFLFPSEKNNSNYIDPTLINLCDNLPITVTKLLSDSDTATSTDDSAETTATSLKQNNDIIQNYFNNNLNNNYNNSNSSNNNSNLSQIYNNSNSNDNNHSNECNSKQNSEGSLENRRLKRQLKLSKDNFLYDSDIFSEQCDQEIKNIESNTSNYFKDLKKSSTEKLFENFDLDEFISSFEDDEKYPIFKDYKEIMLKSNSNNSSSNNFRISSHESLENVKNNENFTTMPSPIITTPGSDRIMNDEFDFNDDAGELKKLIREISKSNSEDSQKRVDSSGGDAGRRYNNNSNEMMQPKKLDEFSEAENQLLKSVQDLENFEQLSPKPYPTGDSDEISSVESFPTYSNQTTASKFSADSAYGRYVYFFFLNFALTLFKTIQVDLKTLIFSPLFNQSSMNIKIKSDFSLTALSFQTILIKVMSLELMITMI